MLYHAQQKAETVLEIKILFYNLQVYDNVWCGKKRDQTQEMTLYKGSCQTEQKVVILILSFFR